VLGNIWESYPVGKLLVLLCAPAALVTWSLRRLIDRGWSMPAPWTGRLAVAGAYLLVPLAVFATVTTDQKDWSDNTQANELAGNGIYQFFAANRNNTLDYEKFYATPATTARATSARATSTSAASTPSSTTPSLPLIILWRTLAMI